MFKVITIIEDSEFRCPYCDTENIEFFVITDDNDNKSSFLCKNEDCKKHHYRYDHKKFIKARR